MCIRGCYTARGSVGEMQEKTGEGERMKERETGGLNGLSAPKSACAETLRNESPANQPRRIERLMWKLDT